WLAQETPFDSRDDQPHNQNVLSMLGKTSSSFSFAALLTALIGLSASTAHAQFNPGPNPISNTVNVAQTLAGGTGIVNASGNLSVGGGTVAVTMSGGTAVTPVTLQNDGIVTQTSTGRAVRST